MVAKLLYPSLKDDRELSGQLEKFIATVKQKNEQASQSIAAAETSRIAQTRKSAKENFAYALLLGVAEAKLKGESIKELNLSSDIDWEEAYRFCLKIGTEIESGMWVNFNNEISRDYGRKFRQLQASLRNDENEILRQQLLNGEIEPVSVTSLT